MKTLSQKIKFFINVILSGGKTGAIATSSDYVVEGVLKHISGPLETVVEYGPGDGVMTKAILKLLAPRGKLVVIESNSKFVMALREIHDSRVHIIEGDIRDVIDSEMRYFKEVDLVLSSIPFSFLKPAERNEIIAKTYAILAPHGSCIIFHQYSTIIKKSLERYFNTVSVSFELRNIFPCFTLFAKKS